MDAQWSSSSGLAADIDSSVVRNIKGGYSMGHDPLSSYYGRIDGFFVINYC
jgi:hypothetical protein